MYLTGIRWRRVQPGQYRATINGKACEITSYAVLYEDGDARRWCLSKEGRVVDLFDSLRAAKDVAAFHGWCEVDQQRQRALRPPGLMPCEYMARIGQTVTG